MPFLNHTALMTMGPVCACRAESQLPVRSPTHSALLTREIPAANSGASSPQVGRGTSVPRLDNFCELRTRRFPVIWVNGP